MLGACLLAWSCSDQPDPDTSMPPIETAFPDRCPATACATGPTITAANELVAMIDATEEWFSYGPYTTGCLPASADLRITGTVTVQADRLAVPASCQGRSDCRQAVWFRSTSLPPGVECLDPEYWFDYAQCAGITLRDTTVRLRMVMQDIHPSAFGNFAPIVDVLPACAAPCDDPELACEATHTCWSSVRDHCAYCLGGSNAACGCWLGARFDDNGARCSIATSGDVIQNGTCHAGACDTSR